MDAKPYARKANYYETDQMGIIHHSNFIRWFEEARVDLMEQLGFGYEKSIEQGVDFALLSVYCEYKSMVRFPDTVNISVEITSLENMKMALSYTVTDSKSGEVRALGETRHCYYDNVKKRPTMLKKSAPQLYELLKSLYSSNADNCKL
ncbi:MAG: acyl-CoA thioesterase [Clostridiales bacterium]|jgi:acyl-CoA thioester hydrolase|nr:acyl-CoA thioesterase [Clostridiales bacterium]